MLDKTFIIKVGIFKTQATDYNVLLVEPLNVVMRKAIQVLQPCPLLPCVAVGQCGCEGEENLIRV